MRSEDRHYPPLAASRVGLPTGQRPVAWSLTPAVPLACKVRPICPMVSLTWESDESGVATDSLRSDVVVVGLVVRPGH